MTTDSPSIQAMTDFTAVQPITISEGENIDKALRRMKRAGVRSLLVVSSDGAARGFITAYDIQSELPVQKAHELQLSRDEITVELVMTPCSQISVLEMAQAEESCVGHILETMRGLGCRHLLVVEHADGAQHEIRGMFSRTNIEKKLGSGVAEDDVLAADSLAEIVARVATA